MPSTVFSFAGLSRKGIIGKSSTLCQRSDTGGVLLEDPIKVFERFPVGYGSTLREKRQAMRDLIASGR